MANQSKGDRMDRSKKGSDPIPRLLFSILRAIDPYLQNLLIFGGVGYQILAKAGIATVPAGPKGTALIAMSAACAIKQIINMTCILETQVPYIGMIAISLYNTITNGIASLSAIHYRPSIELGIPQYVGISLFSVGLLTELISEIQRKRFKDDPANQGKNYSGGLFSLARHINYGGYTLWRTGLALTSGNYWWAALQFIWHTYDFSTRAVPVLGDYCRNRYGEGWKQYERNVPYILFPFIW